jgi:hypothetical protein
MGLMAIYPKKNLSRLGQAKYIRPYLLKDLKIVRPNQVWAIDITYIPMPRGFLYLTAIIDVYSRFVVGWGISNTLDAAFSLVYIPVENRTIFQLKTIPFFDAYLHSFYTNERRIKNDQNEY